MRNKMLEKELAEFFGTGYLDAVPLNATKRTEQGGVSDLTEALRMIDSLRLGLYTPFPEHCFNEPEMVRLAAEKLHSGIESAQKLLRILEKHYGVVEKKQDGNICGGQVSEDDINGYVVRVKDCCCERSCCDEKR